MQKGFNFKETLSVAIQSLATHKLRSILTMLGIIFGVGAVIAMLSIGEGARQESLEQIAVMGVRNIIIRSNVQSEEEAADENIKSRPMGITIKDADAIRAICPFVQGVSVMWESKAEARTYSGHAKVSLVGVTPEYATIFNIKTKEGSFLSRHHIENANNICVIGNEVKTTLFGFENALGKMVKLRDQWFTVIGIVEEKKSATKAAGLDVRNLNSDVYIPLTTAMAKFPREEKGSMMRFYRRRGFFSMSFGGGAYLDRSTIDQITVQVRPEASIVEAAAVINNIMLRRHNNQKDVTITIPEELIKQSQKTQSIFNIVMGCIAGISLLVGGIGIMNIMLASVLERTREIGVRRAVGATKRTVIIQFLSEATMLSIAGGIVGIGLGWGLTQIITAYAGWRTIVNAWAIILAFSVSALTGILFGFYPAKQAAEKDPIEALRYE